MTTSAACITSSRSGHERASTLSLGHRNQLQEIRLPDSTIRYSALTSIFFVRLTILIVTTTTAAAAAAPPPPPPNVYYIVIRRFSRHLNIHAPPIEDENDQRLVDFLVEQGNTEVQIHTLSASYIRITLPVILYIFIDY